MTLLLIDPVIAMLHNCRESTWHPILFELKPLPGADGPARHKSKGHHTNGFSTRDAALAAAKDLASHLEGARLFLDQDIEWDGVLMPALVMFFPPPGQTA